VTGFGAVAGRFTAAAAAAAAAAVNDDDDANAVSGLLCWPTLTADDPVTFVTLASRFSTTIGIVREVICMWFTLSTAAGPVIAAGDFAACDIALSELINVFACSDGADMLLAGWPDKPQVCGCEL